MKGHAAPAVAGGKRQPGIRSALPMGVLWVLAGALFSPAARAAEECRVEVYASAKWQTHTLDEGTNKPFAPAITNVTKIRNTGIRNVVWTASSTPRKGTLFPGKEQNMYKGPTLYQLECTTSATGLNPSDLVAYLQSIGASVESIAGALRNTLNLDPGQIAGVMRGAGYSARQIAGALRSVFASANSSSVAGWLRSAGFTVSQAADALQRTFDSSRTALNQIARAIRQAGYTSRQNMEALAATLKDLYGASREQLEAALEYAGYLADWIAAVLADLYGEMVAQVPRMTSVLTTQWDTTNAGALCPDTTYQAGIGVNKFSGYFQRTSNFTPLNAYLLAQASSKTYHSQFRYQDRPAATEEEYRCAATNLYQKWGFDDVVFVDSPVTNANAIVASNADMVLVVFRGTEFFTRTNWVEGAFTSFQDILLADANVVAVPGAPVNLPGLYHNGFLRSALSTLPSLTQVLGQFGAGRVQGRGSPVRGRAPSRKPVFVAGHSLGAATATLVGYLLHVQGYPVQAVYAYATPKVGDSAFASGLRASGLKLYDFTNYRDPVPTVPRAPGAPGAPKMPKQGLSGISEYQIYKSVPVPDVPNPFVPVYQAAAARIYMDANHRIVFNPQRTDPFLVQRDQRSPPEVTLRPRDTMALDRPDWMYHNGDVYTRILYDHLPRRLRSSAGPALLPELTLADVVDSQLSAPYSYPTRRPAGPGRR